MAYNLTQAANPLSIAEQQYATAAELRFTAFTSCIGVIAKKGALLTAVHLVMSAPDRTLFNSVKAIEVLLTVLPDKAEKVAIIGGIAMWRNPQNNVDKALLKLESGIRSLEQVQIYQFGNGTYGARIDGQDIEITY